MLLSAIQSGLLKAQVRPGAHLVVACSSGVDSMVLLYSTLRAVKNAHPVVAVYVDHQTRPGTNQDRDLVEKMCGIWGARFQCMTVSPSSFSEGDLRKARYAALEASRIDSNAPVVLLAHHTSDQAESVLMGLIRYASLKGMRGMKIYDPPWLRPWLSVPKDQILAAQKRFKIPYRDDPSNVDLRYLRNRVRRELLPLLESRYRSGLAHRLARLAEELQGREEAFYPDTEVASLEDAEDELCS